MTIKWKYPCPLCEVSIIGETNADQTKYELAVARHKKAHARESK